MTRSLCIAVLLLGLTVIPARAQNAPADTLQITQQPELSGSAITLTVTVSGPGELSARGTTKIKVRRRGRLVNKNVNVGTDGQNPTAAGPVELTIPISNAAQKLRASKAVKVSIRLLYAATASPTIEQDTSITLPRVHHRS